MMDILTEAEDIEWEAEISAIKGQAQEELIRLIKYGSPETARAIRILCLKDQLFCTWSPRAEAAYREYIEEGSHDKGFLDAMKPCGSKEQVLDAIRELEGLLNMKDRSDGGSDAG